MTDKAVSTEDLCPEIIPERSLEIARLEAVLNTLVENKVEEIKQGRRKSSSTHSSPKRLLQKFRLASASTASSSDRDDSLARIHGRKTGGYGRRCNEDTTAVKVHRYEKTACQDDGNENFAFVHGTVCSDEHCTPILDCTETCCCRQEVVSPKKMHFEDDYVSLKIEECEGIDMDEMVAREERRIARRKRRRKRRLKRQMAMANAIQLPVNESFKVLDADELSQRARFTIIVTACLLLFMCLLLVGITLRMAPIIDDLDKEEKNRQIIVRIVIGTSMCLFIFSVLIVIITLTHRSEYHIKSTNTTIVYYTFSPHPALIDVRKENEEMMNSLNRETKIHNSLHNTTASVPSSVT